MLRIRFRRFDHARDLKRLFDFMMNESNQILFSHSFTVHDIPMFEIWLSRKLDRNEYHDFFMIEDSNGNTVGFTFSYEFFMYDAHCKYTLCLFEEYRNCGLGVIAGVKMIDYLFRKYPLNRIFVSVFDYNKNSLSSNLKGGFEEVGTFPDYRFYGGEYYSLHILTISRDKFYTKQKKVISNLKD